MFPEEIRDRKCEGVELNRDVLFILLGKAGNEIFLSIFNHIVYDGATVCVGYNYMFDYIDFCFRAEWKANCSEHYTVESSHFTAVGLERTDADGRAHGCRLPVHFKRQRSIFLSNKL